MRQSFRDLNAFVTAVWSHAVVVLTGSGIAAVFTWIPPAFGLPSLPKWVFWCALGVSALWALFRAWRDQYRIANAFAEGRLVCVSHGRGTSRISDTTLGRHFNVQLTNRTATPMVLDDFTVEIPSETNAPPIFSIHTVLLDEGGKPLHLPLQLDAHSCSALIRVEATVNFREPLPGALPYKRSGTLAIRDRVSGLEYSTPLHGDVRELVMFPRKQKSPAPLGM